MSEPSQERIPGFDERVDQLDTSIFAVETQMTQKDRISLLSIQRCVRVRLPGYVYLEIGSHLGGTLLPHLLDPACRQAISIDPRPLQQPDARGRSYQYDANSTERMVAGLRSVTSREDLEKLRTFDCDASEISLSTLGMRPQLVLIDGEHTNIAVFSDFISVFPAIAEDAVVCFHDSNLIVDAIYNIERFLKYNRDAHHTIFLADYVCVIGLRGMIHSIENELQQFSVDRDEFAFCSRKNLNITIAKNVFAAERGILAGPEDPSA